MPYIVNFTDKENKVPVTVYDNTSNADTSLSFPGRNYPGYGQIIAENFLHLLENFASTVEPINPVEGQLWYNTSEGVLKIWDNTQWKAASNIQKSTSEPSVETSRVGELWVDTTNQQLYVFSGSSWILVGPNFSTGLRSGPVVESVIDSDNFDRVLLVFYVEDRPIIIISKDSFTPKNSITGFETIKTGINITTTSVGNDALIAAKFYGTASNADNLVVGGAIVGAGKFLRSDTTNTTEQGFNIRNNAGLTLGIDGTFSLTTSAGTAKIYNAQSGSSIDLQINDNGVANTVLRVINNTVGINIASPDEALSVSGNIKTDGSLILTDVTESTNLNTGTIRTAGGVAITKNLLVGTTLDVYGSLITTSVEPRETGKYDLGTVSRRWNTVRTKSLIADSIEAKEWVGSLIGNATTATNLKFPTTFKMQGDVTSGNITFDGQVGGTVKTFDTTITSGIISNKLEPSPNRSKKDDYVLVFRTGEGLLKQTRDVFIADLGVPIGAIMPYAGETAPTGYLLCDGGEVEISKFRDLYNIIGDRYGTSSRGAAGLTFVLPDLRGRFSLGKHNMDNANTVPIAGGFVDAGGGLPTANLFPSGSFTVGKYYKIVNVGTTDFTKIGAATNTVGLIFKATGSGSTAGPSGSTAGTGTAQYPSRISGLEATTLGGEGGQNTNTLTVTNLPQHQHDFRALKSDGTKAASPFYATRLGTSAPSDLEQAEQAFLGRGPTTPGQMQYLPASGGIKNYETSELGQPFALMNPFLTVNYIIRSGPATF